MIGNTPVEEHKIEKETELRFEVEGKKPVEVTVSIEFSASIFFQLKYLL